MNSLSRPLRALMLALSCTCGAQAATTVIIVNDNGPGVGFNDPTPVEPVGGNSGRTLGAQRLIAFQHAADIWGATVTSAVPVRIAATFEPLPCDEASAVLGAAGTNEIFSDFPHAPKADTWYPSALASKLAGADMATPGLAHIRALFNSRLGLFSDCLPGAPFYLGIDNRHGEQIDLVAVLLHEIAHGLGFQSFTDEASGEQIEGRPAIWDFFLLDSRNNKLWADMSNEERRLSAISGRFLSWNGPQVRAGVPQVLFAAPNLAIGGPAGGAASGDYEAGDATFGPPLDTATVSGELMPLVDQPDRRGLACAPLSERNARAVRGNVALVDRGECAFTLKARHVQDAGARALVVADNVAGPVQPLGGVDPSITIPAVRISRDTGIALKDALRRRSRSRSGVIAALGLDPQRLSGADPANRIRMYSPTELAPGSSVSHFATESRPSQLMEPAINADLTHQVSVPRDLTYRLLQDIGW